MLGDKSIFVSPKNSTKKKKPADEIRLAAGCVCPGDMLLARDQFAELAYAERDMVFRLARRISGNTQRAEDLVQETYLRAVRASATFDLREFGIRPWLIRILHGVHSNLLRSESRTPLPVEDAGDNLPARQLPFEASDDPHCFESMDERLVKAIESLSPPIRDTILLWAIDDLNYGEIAKALGVPIGTVMSRLHRARRHLRDRLQSAMTPRGALQ